MTTASVNAKRMPRMWRDVLHTGSNLVLPQGIAKPTKSQNGPKVVAAAVRGWLVELAVTTLSVERASPWERSHIEALSRTLRDDLLTGRRCYTMKGAGAGHRLALALQRPASPRLAKLTPTGAGGDRPAAVLTPGPRVAGAWRRVGAGPIISSGRTKSPRATDRRVPHHSGATS
jgi:hypothetical protein